MTIQKVEVLKGVVNRKKKGEFVELPEDSVKRLVKAGVVKRPKAETKPKAKTPKAKETKKDKK